MTISVRCPQCGAVHQAAAEMRGKRAKCRCGNILSIPAAAATKPPAGQATKATQGGASTAQGKIQVRCAQCGKIHLATAAMAGTAARCPCGGVVRIPPRAATGPTVAAPSTGVASLMDELTQRDHDRYEGIAAKPTTEEAPRRSDDDLLAMYTTGVSKQSHRRRTNVDRPVGTIILGVLEVIGALLLLFGAIGLCLLLAGVAGLGADGAGGNLVVLTKFKLLFGFMIALVLGGAVLYFAAAVGLFTGASFGWWINACMMAYEPVALVVTFILTSAVKLAAVGGAPVITGPGAKDIVRCTIAVCILVYLLRQNVMDYFEINQNRWAALGIAVAVGAVLCAVVVGGSIGFGYMASRSV